VKHQSGSSLVEVLVSVLLLSMAVLGLMRALTAATRSSGDVEYRSVAATLADERVGLMWIDRANLAAYAETDTAVTAIPNGHRTTTVAGNVATVTVTWRAPTALAASTHSVTATITGP
jgi:type IV pilus assembly protein PilV